MIAHKGMCFGFKHEKVSLYRTSGLVVQVQKLLNRTRLYLTSVSFVYFPEIFMKYVITL